jgi:hypothetical protein
MKKSVVTIVVPDSELTTGCQIEKQAEQGGNRCFKSPGCQQQTLQTAGGPVTSSNLSVGPMPKSMIVESQFISTQMSISQND